MIKCVCYECGSEVAPSVKEHFTADDGRILCDKCSIGIKPCSDDIKKKLIEYEINGV